MIAEEFAPAKIILSGEHAAVYGQPAIAIPIPTLRAKATALAPDVAGQGLKIRAVNLGREFSLIDLTDYDTSNPLLTAARLFLIRFELSIPDLTVDLVSDIPVASGLGSGAAATTAFIRVLSCALNRKIDNNVLNDIVYEAEKLYHGTPSGVDNTVIVYERPVYFVRDQPIEWFSIGLELTFLIGNTGVSASTQVAVSDVRAMYEANNPVVIDAIEAIGRVTTAIRQSIENGDLPTLGQLMIENHRLLQQLTVSSDRLDGLVDSALHSGALGAKLSGGGRGGNMIALVQKQNVLSVRDALFRAGASQVFDVTVR